MRLATAGIYLLAAFFEITGCFAFWAWLRWGRTPWWTGAGVSSLVLFAACLTRVDSAYAGRAFAAYGGVYIVASLLWLCIAEGTRPDRWDTAGAVVCLVGAAIILWAAVNVESDERHKNALQRTHSRVTPLAGKAQASRHAARC